MKTNYPLTLLYDAGCPVCSLEMTHLRLLNDAARLVFVDMSAPGFDAMAYGTTLDALNAEIHGICADGRTLRGLEVLRLAYAAVGLGWVLQPTAWRPLRPLADFAYRAFARHLRLPRICAPPPGDLGARRAFDRGGTTASRPPAGQAHGGLSHRSVRRLTAAGVQP